MAEEGSFVLTKTKERLVVKKLEGRRESPRYYLKPEQIRDLIYHAANPRDRCLIKMLAFSGMRREELRQLDIQDLDFERNLATIRVAKYGKKRTIPISQEVLSDIKFLVGERLKGPIFDSRRSEMVSKRQINRIIEETATRAGIKNPDPHKKHLNPHLLRHSFSRNALKVGVRIEVLMEILGHASIRTTIDTYGTPSIDDISQEYEKLRKAYG